jgi:hypothetical protein
LASNPPKARATNNDNERSGSLYILLRNGSRHELSGKLCSKAKDGVTSFANGCILRPTNVSPNTLKIDALHEERGN